MFDFLRSSNESTFSKNRKIREIQQHYEALNQINNERVKQMSNYAKSLESVLKRYNAVEEEFNVEVENINPMSARKQIFGKARIKGVKAKDFVKEEIEKMYNTKKWCKTTSRGNWDKRNIDAYDGLVMSLFEKKA